MKLRDKYFHYSLILFSILDILAKLNTGLQVPILQLNQLLKMRIYHNYGNQEAEIISDSYKFVFPEEFKGVVCEVQSKMVIPKDVEVDVGCGNAFGGKNEEQQEGGSGAQNQHIPKVNDLIDGFGYQIYAISKDDYKNYYIKDYLKTAIAKVPQDRQANFKAGVQAFVKFLLSKFDDFAIYTPKDNSAEGALIYSIYKNEEDEAPVFYYIIEGLPNFKV